MDDRKHDREFVIIMAIVLCALGAAAWLFFGQGDDAEVGTPHSKTVTVTVDGASYVCKPAPHNPSVE
jgi:hypothetical protein